MTHLALPALQSILVTLICTLCLLPVTGIAGEQTPSTCKALPGTYVATVTDREEVFASRSLLTFTADGILLVTDSGQSGTPELFNPASSGQGIWRCAATTPDGLEIEAVALNFAFAGRDGRQTLGRIDYRLRLITAEASLSGTAELMLTDSTDLEGAEPLTDSGDLIETFGIDGVKLALP